MSKKYGHTLETPMNFTILDTLYSEYTLTELRDITAVYNLFNDKIEDIYDPLMPQSTVEINGVVYSQYQFSIDSEAAWSFQERMIVKMISDFVSAGWDEVEVEKFSTPSLTESKNNLGLIITVREIQ